MRTCSPEYSTGDMLSISDVACCAPDIAVLRIVSLSAALFIEDTSLILPRYPFIAYRRV